LHHTATTHCNTLTLPKRKGTLEQWNRVILQHTATYSLSHCNTLYHCIILQHCIIQQHCIILQQHTATTHYNTLALTKTNKTLERWNRVILKHTATYSLSHCTTLHHTASHCITLHHTATAYCSSHTLPKTNKTLERLNRVILQHTATYSMSHCNALHHTASHCITLKQHTVTTHCNTLTLPKRKGTLKRWNRVILQHTATYSLSHCDTLHHCITLHHTASHCNSTLQHTHFAKEKRNFRAAEQSNTAKVERDGVFGVRNASDFDVKLFHLHMYTRVYTYECINTCICHMVAHMCVYCAVMVSLESGMPRILT